MIQAPPSTPQCSNVCREFNRRGTNARVQRWTRADCKDIHSRVARNRWTCRFAHIPRQTPCEVRLPRHRCKECPRVVLDMLRADSIVQKNTSREVLWWTRTACESTVNQVHALHGLDGGNRCLRGRWEDALAFLRHQLGRPLVDHWGVRGQEVWRGHVANTRFFGVRGGTRGEKWWVKSPRHCKKIKKHMWPEEKTNRC